MSPRRRGLVATLMGGRRRAGIGLLAGGLLVWSGGTAWGLHWVPLLAGLGALLGGYLAGPKDGPWGPGFVLTGFGLALVAHHEGWVSEPEASLLLLGVAAGLVAAAVAPMASTLGSVAVTVAVVAAWHLLRDDMGLLREPTTWALVIAAWAVVHLLELRR